MSMGGWSLTGFMLAAGDLSSLCLSLRMKMVESLWSLWGLSSGTGVEPEAVEGSGEALERGGLGGWVEGWVDGWLEGASERKGLSESWR